MPIEGKIGVIFNVRYIFTQKDEYNRRIVNLHMNFGAIIQNLRHIPVAFIFIGGV